ncbi:MAG TPA: ComEA family DNA-binding protein [Propionibacteriaceae bacterium]|nr:ComEA family DNA-binding protein [Propionibacteriaceae bacterium]
MGRDDEQRRLDDYLRARLAFAMAGTSPVRVPPRRADDESESGDVEPEDADLIVSEPLVALPARPPVGGRPGPARERPEKVIADAATVGGPDPGTGGVRVWAASHLKSLAVILVLALVGAAAWTMRSRATEIPLTVVASVSASTPSPSATPTPTIQVHIIGSVARPGVVVLPPGVRVADAIKAVGGMTKDADPGDLNLAAVVTDGAQVRIGDSKHPSGEVVGAGTTTGSAQTGATIDLNTATAAQLDQLPGVGPVTAAAILTWREEHGRFSRIEELQEVDGIGPKTYAQIAPHVRV